MDQENSYIEEINESDLKDEWFKKVLVVLVTIAVLGGTYYFTISGKKARITAVNTDMVIVKPEIQKTKQLDSKDFKNIKADKPENKVNYHSKSPENSVIVKSSDCIVSAHNNNHISGIKPTNKALAAKSALLVSGKSDPFSGKTETSNLPADLKTFLPRYIGKSPLSIPSSLRNLPNIGSLPTLNVPNSNLLPGKIPSDFQNYPEVKGFIGDKVILNINGVSESLKANESFQGIKVVKVDSQAMTVKFIQDKKVITKTIKGLN